MLFKKKDAEVPRAKQARTTMQKVRTLSAACAVCAAVAVAGAGFGAYSSWQASDFVGKYSDQSQMSKTLVLTKAVGKGQTISEEDVALVDVPASLRVAGALGEDGLAGGSAVVGRAAVVDMGAGTQLTQAFAAGAENKTSLSAALEPGYEAVSISIDAQTGLAGLAKVGDTVRVCTVSDDAVGAQRNETVSDDAVVIALDASLEGAEGYSTVTVQTTSEEADAIRAAQADGTVTLVMKSAVSDAE